MRKTVYVWKGTAGNWRIERALEQKRIKKALGDLVCGVAIVPMFYGLAVLISVY